MKPPQGVPPSLLLLLLFLLLFLLLLTLLLTLLLLLLLLPPPLLLLLAYLGESKDVVYEEKHVLAFLVTEILGNGQTYKRKKAREHDDSS